MRNQDCTRPAVSEGAHPIRTLVADDSAQWLAPLCTFLKSKPAIDLVGTACDGVQALGCVKALRPELVVLDVRMPRLDGLDAAALIRAGFPEVRIVMMSSDDDEETREACLAHGAHAFVAKRGALTALLPAIAELFHARTPAPMVFRAA